MMCLHETLHIHTYIATRDNVQNYNLRNADNYQQVHATSRLYSDSFLPSTIREWNNLPADVKSAHSDVFQI